MAHNRAPLRAAVLASGQGSNAENIMAFARAYPDRLSIPLVVTNRAEAGVIARAAKFDTPCAVLPLDRQNHPTAPAARLAQEKKLLNALQQHDIQWLFLAGYMQLLSPHFLRHFYDTDLSVNRVVNIHPSLLPAFPGKYSYRQAYDANVPEAGVTLHFVDDGMDTGPIIAQEKFRRGDLSFDDFCQTGMTLEYKIYTQFLHTLTEGRLTTGKETLCAQA